MTYMSSVGRFRRMPCCPTEPYIELPTTARAFWLEMWARCDDQGTLYIGQNDTFGCLSRRLFCHAGDKRLLRKYLPLLQEAKLVEVVPPLLIVVGFIEANPPTRERSAEGSVYVLQPRGSSVVKIGKAKDVAKRIAQLQTGHPDPLDLIATLPGGIEREAVMHRALDAFRIRGEWFHATSGLLSYVSEAKEQSR